MSRHTCITDDGGTPNRRCEACEQESAALSSAGEGRAPAPQQEAYQSHCSQCGQLFAASACGPTHAVIHAERVQAVSRLCAPSAPAEPPTTPGYTLRSLAHYLGWGELPDRDVWKFVVKRERGLYRKFIVRRTDGTDAPGGKHDGCNYFVLDVTHDPHAPAGLRGYADSCAADYPMLAANLHELAGSPPSTASAGEDHDHAFPLRHLFIDTVGTANGSRCQTCRLERNHHTHSNPAYDAHGNIDLNPPVVRASAGVVPEENENKTAFQLSGDTGEHCPSCGYDRASCICAVGRDAEDARSERRRARHVGELVAASAGAVEPPDVSEPHICNVCDQPFTHELVCEDCLDQRGFVTSGTAGAPTPPDLKALIAKWRAEAAHFKGHDDMYYDGVLDCADELEAALKVAIGEPGVLPVPPRQPIIQEISPDTAATDLCRQCQHTREQHEWGGMVSGAVPYLAQCVTPGCSCFWFSAVPVPPRRHAKHYVFWYCFHQDHRLCEGTSEGNDTCACKCHAVPAPPPPQDDK